METLFAEYHMFKNSTQSLIPLISASTSRTPAFLTSFFFSHFSGFYKMSPKLLISKPQPCVQSAFVTVLYTFYLQSVLNKKLRSCDGCWYISLHNFWRNNLVGTTTWHHILFLHLVTRFSSQLSCFYLQAHPRTNPDNGRLTVIVALSPSHSV